jgi:hypothetical protein
MLEKTLDLLLKYSGIDSYYAILKNVKLKLYY